MVGDPEGYVQDPLIDEIVIREWLSHLPTGEGGWGIQTNLMLQEELKPLFDERSPLYQGKDFVITHDDIIGILTDLATRIRLRMEKISKRRIEFVILNNWDTAFRFAW